MADRATLACSPTKEKIYKQEIYSSNKCFKCIDLENPLQETSAELSSSQLIIKLLYKELEEATQKYEVRSLSTTQNATKNDTNLLTQWSTVGSKRYGNNKNLRRMELLQTAEPIEVTNRYGVLCNLIESTVIETETTTERIARRPKNNT
jgi:hypothetical protein